MMEPAHRRIEPLDDIEARLDTGPDAYRATWAADSRTSRSVSAATGISAELNIYGIERRHAHLVRGPSLFRDVTDRVTWLRDELRQSYAEVTWTGPRRFTLREHRLFRTSDEGFARRLGAYGKQEGSAMDGGHFVEFAAEADCVLMPGHRYSIVGLRAGKFVDQ